MLLSGVAAGKQAKGHNKVAVFMKQRVFVLCCQNFLEGGSGRLRECESLRLKGKVSYLYRHRWGKCDGADC